MTSDPSPGPDTTPGLAYAHFQLAKALQSTQHHPDAQVRERAAARAERWRQILKHALRGTANYGSRTPFTELPAWTTLEVATGGFATGSLLAGGEPTDYERTLSATVPGVRVEQMRLDLNLWHLTEAGLDHLQRMLGEGCYRIDLPEESALSMVAWLVEQGRIEQAHEVIEAIAPFFDRLRFFPARTESALPLLAEVSIFSAADVGQRLSQLSAQPRLATQRRAIEKRLPLYDATIALFLATFVDGWPGQRYPDGWDASAKALLARIASARSGASADSAEHKRRSSELFALLAVCAADASALNGRQVGRIRRIVDDFVRAHGAPGSPAHAARRRQQEREVASAPYHRIGHAVAARLAAYPGSEGIADFSALCEPITAEEAARFNIEPGLPLPDPVRERLLRCRRGTIAELVQAGIVTSSDTIARVLPALTAEIRSSELADPRLRQLYAATYRAFRKQRSLLLLNLQSQVRLNELPWIAVIAAYRASDSASTEMARVALVESAAVAITAFPHAILPNKLLNEFRALADSATLKLPLVDEIAADIFMGEFTNTFVDAARCAAQVVAGTLYAAYYDIDTDALAALPHRPETATGSRRSKDAFDALSNLAARRAGLADSWGNVATNGAILEQSQILTTHNLAVLFDGAGLLAMLEPTLDALALKGFQWVCRRQQMRIPHWHARLVMLKNTAYAWRQMVFFLSMLDDHRRRHAFARIEAHFYAQPENFRSRFEPVMQGLRLAASGRTLPQQAPAPDGARVFTGWTTGPHWLLPSVQ